MGNNDRRGGRVFDRRNFEKGRGRGGGAGGGRNEGRDRQMFKAVCANCGKDAFVPFRPTSSKPVYCSDCFEKMGGRGARPDRSAANDSQRSGGPQRPQGNQGQQNNTALLQTLSTKLDKIISLLESANPVKPAPGIIEVKPQVVINEEKETEVKPTAEKPEEKKPVEKEPKVAEKSKKETAKKKAPAAKKASKKKAPKKEK